MSNETGGMRVANGQRLANGPRAERDARAGRRARAIGGRATGGFSLLELLLVLVILGLLAGVAAFNVFATGEKAKVRTTKQSMDTIYGAINGYRLTKSELPPTLQALYPEYLDPTKKAQDSWGTAFYYSPESDDPDRPFRFVSFGPDKEAGTPDDIDFWTKDEETGT